MKKNVLFLTLVALGSCSTGLSAASGHHSASAYRKTASKGDIGELHKHAVGATGYSELAVNTLLANLIFDIVALEEAQSLAQQTKAGLLKSKWTMTTSAQKAEVNQKIKNVNKIIDALIEPILDEASKPSVGIHMMKGKS